MVLVAAIKVEAETAVLARAAAEMVADDFREGVLGVVPGVAIKQLVVAGGDFAHVQKCIVARDGNPTGNLWSHLARQSPTRHGP